VSVWVGARIVITYFVRTPGNNQEMGHGARMRDGVRASEAPTPPASVRSTTCCVAPRRLPRVSVAPFCTSCRSSVAAQFAGDWPSPQCWGHRGNRQSKSLKWLHGSTPSALTCPPGAAKSRSCCRATSRAACTSARSSSGVSAPAVV
jgi:hypothetical protein